MAENPTEKVSDVASETLVEQKICAEAAAAAAAAAPPTVSTAAAAAAAAATVSTAAAAAAAVSAGNHLADGETPCPWRTNLFENPTEKLSNVASETLVVVLLLLDCRCSYCCCCC